MYSPHTNAALDGGAGGDAQTLDTSTLPPEGFKVKGFTPSAVYRYSDAEGNPLYAVARFEAGTLADKKQFKQYRWEAGRWLPGLQGGTLPLFGLHLLNGSGPVLLAEGEKCVLALRELGYTATTTPGGTGNRDAWLKARPDALSDFKGRVCFVLPDNDTPGVKHARIVGEALRADGADVRIVDVAGWAHLGKTVDVADLIAEGAGRAEIDALLDAASPLDVSTPTEPPAPKSKRDDMPPLPLDALPGNLGAYVAAEAANKETSPEMAFGCALAVMSAAVPAFARSEWRGGWSEIAPLWVVIVAPSGDIKTPVLEALCKPMRDHDRALRGAFELAKDQHEVACAKHAEAAGRRKKSKTPMLEPPEPAPKPPAQPHTIVDSVTIEKLADVLNDNARFGFGCLWMSDEFVGRLMALNQYKGGKGDDVQFFLKLHPGSPVHVLRLSRSVFVDAPRISLIGTVQPKMLIELGKTDTEDGTFERLHFVLAGDPGAPKKHVPQVPQALRDEWRQRLRELLPPATADELLDAANAPPPEVDAAVLELEPDAWELFGDWHEANDKRSIRESWYRGYFAKSKGEALRLILVLHYWTHGTDAPKRKASADTVRRALTIIEWLKAHTYRARGLMSDGFAGSAEARPVLAYLRKHRNRHIELRELVQRVRTCRDGVQRARELVQELVDLGYAEWVDHNTVTLAERSAHGR